MKPIINFFIFLIFLSNSFLFSQNTLPKGTLAISKITEDTIVTRSVDCNALFTLNNRKNDYLDKKPYIYSEPYYLRVFNSKKDYAVLQIAKRKKSKPILYVHIFTYNTCIKKDEVIEFILNNDYRYRLKSIYDPNCDGFVISKIKRRNIKKLTQSYVSSLKILAFDKDFEFHFKTDEAERFQDELQCLKYNRFKYK